jgi:hypothetical protein
MAIVEDSLILQADEVGTADITGQLYNFMPDLVILSALPLMRDPRLALPRRLRALQESASSLGVVTVCIVSTPSRCHEWGHAQKECGQQYSLELCAPSDHILAYELRHVRDFVVDGAQRTPDWVGHRIPSNICQDSRKFRLHRQGLKEQGMEATRARGGEQKKTSPPPRVVLFLKHTCMTPAVKAATARLKALLAASLEIVTEVGASCAV